MRSSWEQFAAELERTGLHVPPTEPGPGSVLAFDAAGRAEVMVQGAQQPEDFVAAVRMRLPGKVKASRGRSHNHRLSAPDIAGIQHPGGNPAGTLDTVAGFDWISLCTDYGCADGFVAACHGVIARIAPHTRVLDVTHAVAPGDVRHGSVLLADTLPWLPAAVHVAVVDPGVGTARRGVALVSGDAVLVGPDNGLLLPAAEVLGGARAAYELVEPAYRLPTVSATFHGRDVFAPAAAHLAVGVPPDALGPAIDLASLVVLPAPVCEVDGDRIRAEVLTVDHFGNLALAAGAAELDAIGLRTGAAATLQWPAGAQRVLVGKTFADVPQGELVLLVDSAGHLALARRGGSAALHTGLRPGAVVELIATPDG